jgi:MoaA/NifB/PqqE/SkfB family radical SAM enzyme
LARIVTAFSDRLPNCAFWLPTNGWRSQTVEATVRTLLEAGVSRLGVGVSLHGDDERHDAYTGRPGSRERALETLRRLTALREDHPSLRVGAGFTIAPDNLACLVPACDTARSMGADFTCRLANPSDIYFGYSAPEGYSPEFLPELDAQLSALERQMGLAGPSLSPTLLSRRRYYRGIREYARDPARVRMPCRAGKTSVFITAKGIVYPCLFVPTPMGDLRERGLLHILNAPENRKLQKAIRAGDCPNCWVECETYRILYENAVRVAASGMWEAFRSRLSRRPSVRRSGVAPGADRASSAT